MTAVQLDLFPDLAVAPTLSDVRAGGTRLRQCSNCGLLVAAPDCGQYRSRDPLAACPRCGRDHWWDQTLPVGPFDHNRPPDARVIGCVWGAHRELTTRLGTEAPTYDWCEAVWSAVRRHAPPPGPELPGWLLGQLLRLLEAR
jgi:hypothetical protein